MRFPFFRKKTPELKAELTASCSFCGKQIKQGYGFEQGLICSPCLKVIEKFERERWCA